MQDRGIFRFSSDDLPERERFSAWQDTFGRSVAKMDMEPLGDGPSRSAADVYLLPDLTIAAMAATPARGTRTRAHAADGSDDIVLAIMTRGEAHNSQGNKQASFATGEAVLWPNDAAGTGGYHEDVEFLTLAMPRALLTAAVPDIDGRLMQTIPRGNSALGLLTGYVQVLRQQIGGMTPELKAACSTHLRDLVALAVGASGDTAAIARGRGARVARLRAVKADIVANLTRPDLSVDWIATRHGISPRYMRTLFGSEHTTFSDFVLEQRLARVHRHLGAPRFASHMISTLAFEAGFGDLSYFNLAFRRRYGVTPSDIRDAARLSTNPTR